ncbi:MAG: acetate--CoA ligase [Candidatus Omnitrophota bacterium]|nr:acetate--CoA ligase [Candidatus Omnitrophota bacterium]MDZ4242589.1 acetate--CoA ligase [Candidatus Omnitrophota bacterium]
MKKNKKPSTRPLDVTAATLDDLLKENRHFKAGPEFRRNSNIKSAAIYQKAAQNPQAFWAEQAKTLVWFKKWTKVLNWTKAPFAQWFINGKLNACYNCVDRHIQGSTRNKAALIWEGEPGDQRTLTYYDLYREVNKLANALKALGLKKGDRVAIYLPMIPEAVISMLACARIGAVHTVVFGGFSAEALRDRINDASAKLLITADGGYRRGNVIALKSAVDEAIKSCPSIEKVIVVNRTNTAVTMQEGRDVWYHNVVKTAQAFCKPEPMDSEDLLYILYTSGTTGRPKGIVHSTGGYMTGVTYTTKCVFDLKPEDVFWCTADVGWVTGHSYVTYGPLSNAATVVIYEGSPDWPQRDRFWRIIEKYGVTIFYTAPTAIRSFMKWGNAWPQGCDLSSLRLLGSVGEPINPEAWVWYYKYIGKGQCPIVDTWWQTETGSILISPLPGLTTLKPGSATRPLPGIEAKVVDEDGKEIKVGGGFLVLTSPWPSMLRGIYGDPERYVRTYWGRFDGKYYFTGDGAKKDKDGYLWLMGRVDDIMLVAGHNISTMEVESALVDHPCVAESAVVGIKDDIKGQAIAAFVTLKEGNAPGKEMEETLKQHVVVKIGSIARPSKIIFTADLPKTRSGKIMRRLLRDVAEGRALGDVTTLADAGVVEILKKKYEEE